MKTKDHNKELNALPAYRARCCRYCGRSYPETILNIEAYIHHNQTLRCIDTMACETARKVNLKEDLKPKKNGTK